MSQTPRTGLTFTSRTASARNSTGRDIALRCPRPRSEAGGTDAPGACVGFFVAPLLNAARTAQRAVPTTIALDPGMRQLRRRLIGIGRQNPNTNLMTPRRCSPCRRGAINRVVAGGSGLNELQNVRRLVSCPRISAAGNPSGRAFRRLAEFTVLPACRLPKLDDCHSVGAPVARAEEFHDSVVEVQVKQANSGSLASVFGVGSL